MAQDGRQFQDIGVDVSNGCIEHHQKLCGRTSARQFHDKLSRNCEISRLEGGIAKVVCLLADFCGGKLSAETDTRPMVRRFHDKMS
jgi:hypothetical protein